MNWNNPVASIHKRTLTPEELAAKKSPAVDFFARLGRLESLRLFDWVPYVFEGEDATAEPVFPCGQFGLDGVEDQIGLAAYRAGEALLTPEQVAWAQGNGLWLVPLQARAPEATTLGYNRSPRRCDRPRAERALGAALGSAARTGK